MGYQEIMPYAGKHDRYGMRVVMNMGGPRAPAGPGPAGWKHAPRTGGGQAPPAAPRDCFDG